jgi:hypothetical protein
MDTSTTRLPAPELRLVYRIRATLQEPLTVGVTPAGQRRLVAFAGGEFAGPELSGQVLPGGSADWQVVHPDGSVAVDIRYTLRTDAGALVLARAAGVRHGPPEVLARLAAGEEVAADEYTFRVAVSLETADPDLDWLNRGVFLGVGGREPGAVVYDVYLVA